MSYAKLELHCAIVAVAAFGATVAAGDPATLTKDRFLDKCKGAWAGQMIGVCFGAPYEFRSNAKPITDPIDAWRPDRVKGAIQQDDCYVEMTFLKALETHGLDITFEEAGRAFAATRYPLWHANFHGRENVRHGVMPPMSGHPLFNRHADDIDFQIEADLFGILCPGLPNESNRLCEVFGRIMNYGDGLYGGMFVAGMYAEAYFEDEDVGKVIAAGLACIPEASQYHQCISDVIAWHRDNPTDWLTTWNKIEAKWQDDADCAPGNPFNIDAKLNGAYIVMGLLYGGGDFLKTVEVSTRCGQDADCNPSNAAGVLGCMKGFEALGAELTGGIAAIADRPFSHTDYSFNRLVPACARVTEQIIVAHGGSVLEDRYEFERQTPRPSATLEQWVDQKEMLAVAIAPSEVNWWDPNWKVVACGHDMAPGYRAEHRGRKGVLALHPVGEGAPAVLVATFHVPPGAPRLRVETASDPRGDYVLKILVNGEPKHEETIDTKGEWKVVTVELTPYTGKLVDIRLECHADEWSWEAAYFAAAQIET